MKSASCLTATGESNKGSVFSLAGFSSMETMSISFCSLNSSKPKSDSSHSSIGFLRAAAIA